MTIHFGGSKTHHETLDSIPHIHPEHNDAAVRQVCARAADADEARALIAMLGLTVNGQTPAPRAPATEPRQGTETLADYPSHGIGRRRIRPGTPCAAQCGRALRPSGSTADKHPGTVKHAGRGLCAACHTKLGANA